MVASILGGAEKSFIEHPVRGGQVADVRKIDRGIKAPLVQAVLCRSHLRDRLAAPQPGPNYASSQARPFGNSKFRTLSPLISMEKPGDKGA